ncbi:ImmA/IrrE family metallo-endopeptidase [Gracilibacillus caseinilyticus]|uniref:ImmA/IrrE family metallo-endopeptidase n=1 Tax=Gracilibacillus caseinilyticus TaxID=2932256 RepID=A0ABY4ET07_9BACI|nr:ImmA/IrrE family metallo-endopeptidase [Gracilibacillus caseinilyticus]UOQ47206.1 ImmA/IrrE family metallo-endopeptidase [Gracilibacillus caseinilyticus]
MSYIYKPFDLERWISKHYLKKGITKPSHMDIEEIAKSFDVQLGYREKRSYSFAYGNSKIISIDSKLTIEEQHEQFFHELCHILRHCGSQLIMPKAFRDLQEWDAKRFTRYAAIPLHMVQQFDLKSDFVIEEMSYKFNINSFIVKERLEGIYRNKRIG